MEEINGGEWRIPVQIISNTQPYDQTVILPFSSSTIDKASVKFQKNTGSDRDLSFEAYFTSDSPTGFSVTPRSGTLKSHYSMGDGDNWFNVNYLCQGSERNVMGYLMIRTGDGKSSVLQIRTGGTEVLEANNSTSSGAMGSIMQSRILDPREYSNMRPSSSPGGSAYKRVSALMSSALPETTKSPPRIHRTNQSPKSPKAAAMGGYSSQPQPALETPQEVFSPRLPSLKPRSMLKLNVDDASDTKNNNSSGNNFLPPISSPNGIRKQRY